MEKDKETKMILLDCFKDKRVGVLGFGQTGRTIVDSLVASNAHVFLYDDSGIKDENYKKYYANLLDEEVVKTLDVIVMSPGIHLFWPTPHLTVLLARKHDIDLVGDIDLFQMQNCFNADSKISPKKIIAITGTNGKSTTTALTAHILKNSKKKTDIGGNFGPPVLALDGNCDFYVLELSSYQLEHAKILGFDTAVLLNITPDHITRHGGMAGYISAKQKVFVNAKNSIIAVDDNHCVEIFNFLKGINQQNLIPVSGKFVPENGIGWKNDFLIDNRFGNYETVCKNHPKLDGEHNRQNIAATYAACTLNGIDKGTFETHLFSFSGLAHRQEFIADIDGIPYINDSKATNADSVEQALLRFNNIFWILGGRPKEGGIFSLEKYFSKIKHAFLIGEVAQEWYDLLTSHKVNAEISETLENAVNCAHQKAKDERPDVILLSPACASFDQFKSFEERGEKFREFVEKLKTEN